MNKEIKNPLESLPDFPIPGGFENANAYLEYLAAEGLAKRYSKTKEENGKEWEKIKERMEYELSVITQMGFSNYFLIVADYTNWAKEHSIPVGTGRAAGASSIAAYALGITNIDPLKFDLLFERFINPLRFRFHDFDIDFSNQGWKDVTNYIVDKYGKDNVGHIAAYFKNSDYVGIHPCAIVISKFKLDDILPVKENTITDDPIKINIQHDKSKLEELGFVIFDLLRLETLDIIKHTEELIRLRGGDFVNFQIDDIPDNDTAVFMLFGEGNTDNIFQFDSDGMKDILKQAKPDKITDLIALNALFRPEAMQYIPQFIDSKNGKLEITYPIPCLEDILKETYGVIVYQEQIMLIAQRIAGYSLGKADILRRMLTNKNTEEKEIGEERYTFVAESVLQGFVEREQAEELFDELIALTPISFNKSHAAAYATLAYQSAYLKANFPEEFETACKKYV